MSKYLLIEYCNPTDHDDVVNLKFKIRNHRVAREWAHRVTIASNKFSIDHPSRFIGFFPADYQQQMALMKINSSVNEINQYRPIIDRVLTDIKDQDTLNYFHHIFEIYHGLLHQQTHSFWNTAPENVKIALSNLNIQVHECEMVGRSITPKPIQYTTWFSMKKVGKFLIDDYKLLEDCSKNGTVYFLYSEIGKTLEDLCLDNDNYISNEAFQPYQHLSPDFCITFYDDDIGEVIQKRQAIADYYNKNQEFFKKRDLSIDHPFLKPGKFPLADIDNPPENVVKLIESHQFVKSVKIL